MSRTVCLPENCTGCGACTIACAKNAIEIIDSIDTYCPEIDNEKCIKCGKCFKTCPSMNYPPFKSLVKAYQGWAIDSAIREKSSSGGIASSIIKSFINDGGYVCTCTANENGFSYKIIRSIDELQSVSGSKYVKGKLEDSYKAIIDLLFCDYKVLFIGLP